MPVISVKPCHFKRFYNYIKNLFYSCFKIPFLSDSPFLWKAFHKTGYDNNMDM